MDMTTTQSPTSTSDKDNEDNSSPSLSSIVPAHIAELMGPPPILKTESREAYDRFVIELAREWCPRATIEWLLLLDLAHVSWDILRLQRAAANIVNISTKEALAAIFVDVLPGSRRSLTREGTEAHSDQATLAEELADAWFEGLKGRLHVRAQLTKYDLDTTAIAAQAYVGRGTELERIDRMLTNAVLKRTAILRTFDQYRTMVVLPPPVTIDSAEVPRLAEE
jgi:hypothetical protein